MKHLFYATLITSCVLMACKESSNKKTPVVPRDETITPANSFSELFLDSTSLEKFIATHNMHDSLANRMRSFYNSRNYQYAWFLDDGLAPYASSFQQMQDEYTAYSRDSSLNNPRLKQFIDSFGKKQNHFKPDSSVLQNELLLTYQFFRYSSRAYQGRRQLDMKDLGWYIPRKRIDPASLLDSIISKKGSDISRYEPVNRQYNLLKNFLMQYYQIEQKGGWQPIELTKKTYEVGDESPEVQAIKKRLQLTNDYSGTDTTAVFTDSLKEAVKNFQRRYGITANGAVNQATVKEMNKPVEDRIRQMLINMERIRWVPAQPPAAYLLVNIPEFRLHVYDKGDLAWSSNVVVGSAAHNTVIFTGTLQNIVFSPYWNVPNGIYKNEVLPGMQRDKNSLAKHNMEKFGNGVRQKPGPANSLGLVKFLFPNSYDIYFHDTPSKSLFREDARAFSHGCIRLSEPKKLAQWLLRNNPGWDSVSITKAMNSGKEKWVSLKETLPVYIGYFTAWVDREGKLNFRNDIYGHDKKMATHLFMDAEAAN
jgi:murein L,D-transpeptidase YcbB/YkuD